jgi:site-specific DNA-adenine methylase
MSPAVRKARAASPADRALRRVRTFLQLNLPHVPPPIPKLASERIDLAKTIWGSPAGKKRLSGRLVKLIPPHKTYVEPFAGSGAVFFAKEPADTEVLSDVDPEIADAYKTLTTLTNGELASLKKKDWTGRERTFRALKEAKPSGRVDKLYRFLYLSHFAYGALRGKSYNAAKEGIEAHTIARIEKHRDRLRGVQVRSAHYADVVKEFDGKDTFFFLDPPYPGHNVQVGEDRFDETEFRKVMDSIKGQFLITYGTRGKLDTSGFEVRKIRTRRTMASMHGVGGPKTLPQLLIANYSITHKSLGPYLLDEVVAAIELDMAAAADLEYARLLVKALAGQVRRPPIAAVDRALDSLEGIGDGRAEVLARALLPIGDRLGAALGSAAPAISSVLRNTRPELARLAKIEDRCSGEEAPLAPTERRAAGEPAAPAGAVQVRLAAALEKRIPVIKTDEERYVLGIVLEPETVDAQQDIYAAAEIREAAHTFMAQYQNVGLMHQGLVNSRVKILESYLAPVSFELGGVAIKKGTWLLALRVLDDPLWEQIKTGELTGLSMGGSAVKVPENDASGAP